MFEILREVKDVCCCLQTCNSVVYVVVKGLVLGQSLMVISTMSILLSQSTVVLCIIGMDKVLAHYACTFENSNLHFHFQLTQQDDS